MNSPSAHFRDVDDVEVVIDEQQLSRMARLSGAMPAGQPITPQLKEFAMMVMEKCAATADPFVDERYELTAGDEIRARFGLL